MILATDPKYCTGIAHPMPWQPRSEMPINEINNKNRVMYGKKNRQKVHRNEITFCLRLIAVGRAAKANLDLTQPLKTCHDVAAHD